MRQKKNTDDLWHVEFPANGATFQEVLSRWWSVMLEENLELFIFIGDFLWIVPWDSSLSETAMWDNIFWTFFKRRRVANPRETYPFTSLGALKEEIEWFFHMPNGGFVDDHVSFWIHKLDLSFKHWQCVEYVTHHLNTWCSSKSVGSPSTSLKRAFE